MIKIDRKTEAYANSMALSIDNSHGSVTRRINQFQDFVSVGTYLNISFDLNSINWKFHSNLNREFIGTRIHVASNQTV